MSSWTLLAEHRYPKSFSVQDWQLSHHKWNKIDEANSSLYSCAHFSDNCLSRLDF
jgi:hypothetical protein